MSPDHALPLPANVFEEPGRLPGPPDSLAYAGPASHRPFLAASRWASVHGTEMAGITAIDTNRRQILTDLGTGAGICANVVLGPRGVRRALLGRGGSVLETVVVSDRQPGVVIQWSTSVGMELALDVNWTSPGSVSAHRSSSSVLRVRPDAGPDRLYALHPAPEAWDMETGPEGLVVRVRIRSADGRITLLVGAVPTELAGDDLLRNLARTDWVATRASAFIDTVRSRRLATRTGVFELDEGLAWANARIADLGDPEGRWRSTQLDTLWVVAGALAAGDRETARALLEPAPRGPADVLALARWVLWTGDTGPFVRHRAKALAIVRTGTGGVVGKAARPATLAALEALGDHASAAELKRPRSLQLPTLSGPGDPNGGSDAVLAAVLGTGVVYVRHQLDPGNASDRALRSWALCASGQPDAGYALLRDHLAQGLRTGAGLWPGTSPGAFHDPVAAALVPAAVLNGLLGAWSEAPWGRLRLAPRLPALCTRFDASGIHVGDARVSIGYREEGDARSFRLEQTEGKLPLGLVFEPSVVGSVREVFVDGAQTDIEPERDAGRSRISLQLPLDGERTVTLVGSAT